MAVYEVTSPTGEKTLVECRIRQTAINHVSIAKGWTAIPLRNTMDVVRRVQAGAVVEVVEEAKPVKDEDAKPIIDHIEGSKAAEAEAGNESGSGATAGHSPASTTDADEQPRKGGRFLSRKSA